MNKKAERMSIVGVLAAFAAVLSYVEAIISFDFFVPGVKLGLANLAVVVTMYVYGSREAVLVNIIRIFIVGLLFTNLFSILFSLAGAFISFGAMVLIRRTDAFSVVGVSVIGGVFHNLGQLAAAAVIVETYSVIYYLPALLIAGIITGVIIGIVSRTVIRYLRVFIKAKKESS